MENQGLPGSTQLGSGWVPAERQVLVKARRGLGHCHPGIDGVVLLHQVVRSVRRGHRFCLASGWWPWRRLRQSQSRFGGGGGRLCSEGAGVEAFYADRGLSIDGFRRFNVLLPTTIHGGQQTPLLQSARQQSQCPRSSIPSRHPIQPMIFNGSFQYVWTWNVLVSYHLNSQTCCQWLIP